MFRRKRKQVNEDRLPVTHTKSLKEYYAFPWEMLLKEPSGSYAVYDPYKKIMLFQGLSQKEVKKEIDCIKHGYKILWEVWLKCLAEDIVNNYISYNQCIVNHNRTEKRLTKERV